MSRRRGLWLSGVATAVLFLLLVLVDRKIQDGGGTGIIPFELARTSDRAREILAGWDDAARDAARLSLWIDFPYLVAYGAFFALAVAAVRDAAASRGWRRWSRAGSTITLLPIVAAACDAVENVSLLLVLGGATGPAAPALAFAFAIAKFAALTIFQLYLLTGLAAISVARRQRQA